MMLSLMLAILPLIRRNLVRTEGELGVGRSFDPPTLADRSSASGQIRIEDTDLLPGRFLFFDELEMTRCRLVVVMSLAAFEDHVERDVELAIIDGPRQIGGECSDRKVCSPRMIG